MTHFKLLHTTVWALLIALSTAVAVHAHGTMEYPGSRSWLCFLEGPVTPDSAACQAAVRVSGTQHLYEWDSINQGNAAGNHQKVIEDGELCNAGHEAHAGINLAREDWPKTPIFPNENGRLSMIFNASATHQTDYWRFYLTKDGWDPLEPLKWSDLETEPFCELGNLPAVGPVREQRYEFDCPMPVDKEGYHVLYQIWQRTDSPEAYYACSDVVVMGIEPSHTPTSSFVGPCAEPPYSNVVAYREGDIVVFGVQAWEAKWWVKNENPGTGSSWQLVEDCTGTITPFPTDPPLTNTPTRTPRTGTPTATPSQEPMITSTPQPTNTPDLTPTLTPTSASIYPAGAPLNVGHAAGSNGSPNSVIGLFVITASLGLLGTVKMVSGRKV